MYAAQHKLPFTFTFTKRFLLEGVYTGSVYMDKMLRRRGFPGERVVNGSVVVVKTHKSPRAGLPYERVVLLLRDPYGAFLAEFNRQHCSHTCEARDSLFHSCQYTRILTFSCAALASVMSLVSPCNLSSQFESTICPILVQP